MRRFSILTLMAVVLVSAVGLAALRNANAPWAGGMLLSAMVSSGVAVLGAALMRGRERAWWQGFALFSGGYLVSVLLVPSLSGELGMDSLFEYLRAAMFPIAAQAPSDLEAGALSIKERNIEVALSQLRRTASDFDTDPAAKMMADELVYVRKKLAAKSASGPRSHDFRRVGQSLLALLAGLMGGTIAAWFHARRVRDESAAGKVQA